MKSEADAFLDLVRDAEQPTSADEARVRRALQAAVAAGAFASVSVPAGFGASGWGRRLAQFTGIGTQLGLIGVCTSSLFLGSDAARLPIQTAKPAGLAEAGVAARVPVLSGPSLPTPRELSSSPPLVEPAGPVARAPRTAPAAPARAAAHTRSAAPQNSLRSELDLLERVQAALKRGDGAGALRQLDAHRTRDRMLLAEREAARVLALCQLGRVEEARQAADRFNAQHPDSMQREAIARSCANR